MYKYIFIGLIFIFSNLASADFRFTHNKHTYDVITTASTYTNASTAAQTASFNGVTGYLARIDDAAENTAIFNQLMSNISSSSFSSTMAPDGGGGSYIWLGASDVTTEGTWIWASNNTQFWSGNTSGSIVGSLYNNWGNEPDNFNNQDAVGISLDGWPLGIAGQWNDIDISNNLYYIIEYETVVAELTPKEGNSNHSTYFILDIGNPLTVDASVDYTTRDGTATAGSDYKNTSGTATIKVGKTRAFIEVEIIADTTAENSENFILAISNPQGAIFPEGITEITATRTIIDDD